MPTTEVNTQFVQRTQSHIDSLTAELVATRAKLRESQQEVERMLLHAKGDVWYWHSTEENNLASMSGQMIVVISANDLKHAIFYGDKPNAVR